MSQDQSGRRRYAKISKEPLLLLSWFRVSNFGLANMRLDSGFCMWTRLSCVTNVSKRQQQLRSPPRSPPLRAMLNDHQNHQSKQMEYTVVVGNNDQHSKFRLLGRDRTISLHQIQLDLQVLKKFPCLGVDFACTFTSKGCTEVLDVTAENPVKVPNNATNICVYWKCSSTVTLDKTVRALTYSSLCTVDEFLSSSITSFKLNPVNVALVDHTSKKQPVYTVEEYPEKLFLQKTRLKYSDLTMRQVQERVVFSVPPTKGPALTGKRSRAWTMSNLMENSRFYSTDRLRSAVDAYLAQKDADPSWNSWIDNTEFYLNGIHEVMDPALHPLEAPRRAVTDPLLVTALKCLPHESGEVKFAAEKKLYKDTEVPNTTVGWGPLDYLVSRVVIRELNKDAILDRTEDNDEAESDTESDDDEPAAKRSRTAAPQSSMATSSSAAPSMAAVEQKVSGEEEDNDSPTSGSGYRVGISTIELKQYNTLNNDAMAQVVGQGVDVGNKSMEESACQYPFVVYPILSTGQRYYVFTLTWSSQGSKPVLQYHGMQRIRVLPYSGPVDPDNSGLDLARRVDRKEVAAVVAALSVCFTGDLSGAVDGDY